MQTQNKPQNIDEYIAQFPKEVQVKLNLIRTAIKKILPHATEKLSYGIPTFFQKKNIIHFAAFQNHIGLYATPSGHEAFKEELSKYKQGKGSVQLPLDETLPLELIQKITQFRKESLGITD
jgi:uncharacterized protein YdhG (YjbR/CyaY superfamily)